MGSTLALGIPKDIDAHKCRLCLQRLQPHSGCNSSQIHQAMFCSS